MNEIEKIIIAKNFQMNQQNLKLSLEEYAILSYIVNEKNKEVKFSEVLKFFNIEKKELENIINLLEKKEYITLEYSKVENSLNLNTNNSQKLLSDLFGLTLIQAEKIDEIIDIDIKFIQLMNLISSNQKKFKKRITINSIEDYKNYLINNTPILIFNNLGCTLNVNEYRMIFERCYVEKRNIGLINFLIEYSVKTSIYNNFSLNFFNKVLENWDQKNIQTIEQAMQYINEMNEKKDKKIYENPDWQEVSITKEEIMDIKDLEKILKEKNLT